jgi:hypothetical protein
MYCVVRDGNAVQIEWRNGAEHIQDKQRIERRH